jgi:hypothetical protein
MEKIVVGDVRFVTDDSEMLGHGLETVMGENEKMVVEKYALRPWVEVEDEDADPDGEFVERYAYVVRFAGK